MVANTGSNIANSIRKVKDDAEAARKQREEEARLRAAANAAAAAEEAEARANALQVVWAGQTPTHHQMGIQDKLAHSAGGGLDRVGLEHAHSRGV